MIRNAKLCDLDEIIRIYDTARQFMVLHGNKTQWAGGYPKREMLIDDINKGNLYVAYDENSIYGVFAFIFGIDETYINIENGSWMSDEPYAAIHRVGSDGTHKGVMRECFSFCRERIKHIRIDTHEDNFIMQGALEKCGFKKCGIIYVYDGTPRIAYEIL